MKAYKLTSENLRNVGTMGGSSYINYTKYFTNLENAKKFARDEYKEKNNGKTFRFKKETNNRLTSGDKGYVLYDITPVKFEDL